jgi:hypothetical protein
MASLSRGVATAVGGLDLKQVRDLELTQQRQQRTDIIFHEIYYFSDFHREAKHFHLLFFVSVDKLLPFFAHAICFESSCTVFLRDLSCNDTH